jgi:hypothetical protein
VSAVEPAPLPADLPARAVIIATRNLEGALSEAREACERAGALAIPWDGQAPLPELPQAAAGQPLAVLGALASGERQIPEDLLRLCTRERPGASLLLLCRESLVRPTVSLQNGRVTLIEPPFSVRRIASRLRLMLAPPGAERGEEERTSLIGEAASALVTVHQHQQAAYWVGALAREGPQPESSGPLPPALLEEGRGLTVLVPAPGAPSPPPLQVGERCTRAADIVLGGGDAETLGGRLREALGDSAGLLFLSARGDEWLVYWPAVAWRVWLYSTQRLPSWWDLGSTAAGGGARCLRLSACSGDVVLMLPVSASPWAQQAARPGQPGQVPGDLTDAAVDGGPALLEIIAARWRGQRESACALILEVR